MADIFARGSRYLTDRLKAGASVEVVYARGVHSVTLQAVLGRQDYEQEDGAGAITRFSERDFIIERTDLVLDGAYILPQEGDTITQQVSDSAHEFTVGAPVTGQAPWKYTDGYQLAVRIHTKLTSAQTASPAIPADNPGGGV